MEQLFPEVLGEPPFREIRLRLNSFATPFI